MELIKRSDIRGPALYAGFRDDLRKKVIELKRPRRISIGDRVTLVFENRATLLFQIEEMLRAEALTTDDKIQEEIDVYNALMPGDNSLSATLFIEVPPDTNAREELDRLIGLDERLILHVGEHAIRAAFEEGRGTTDRISAVQYTRYVISDAAKRDLAAPGTKVVLEIDHPEYSHSTACSEQTRESLAADFA